MPPSTKRSVRTSAPRWIVWYLKSRDRVRKHLEPLLDRVLGVKQIEQKSAGKPVHIQLTMDEGDYWPVAHSYWTRERRPRWWAPYQLETEIECEVGIPFPLKDKTVDYLYKLRVHGNADIAAEALIDQVMAWRIRHASPAWRPPVRGHKTMTEAQLSPIQRKALKRLEDGRRNFQPIKVECDDGVFEIQKGGTVYERVPMGAKKSPRVTGVNHRNRTVSISHEPSEDGVQRSMLKKVTDPVLISRVQRLAIEAQGGKVTERDDAN